jgi:hypothetical protein
MSEDFRAEFWKLIGAASVQLKELALNEGKDEVPAIVHVLKLCASRDAEATFTLKETADAWSLTRNLVFTEKSSNAAFLADRISTAFKEFALFLAFERAPSISGGEPGDFRDEARYEALRLAESAARFAEKTKL